MGKLAELELEILKVEKVGRVRVSDVGPNSTRVRELILTLF